MYIKFSNPFWIKNFKWKTILCRLKIFGRPKIPNNWYIGNGISKERLRSRWKKHLWATRFQGVWFAFVLSLNGRGGFRYGQWMVFGKWESGSTLFSFKFVQNPRENELGFAIWWPLVFTYIRSPSVYSCWLKLPHLLPIPPELLL